MAPSSVSRAEEITNASEIFFICKTANPLDCQQVQNEAPICQMREFACISEQKPDLFVSRANWFAYIRWKQEICYVKSAQHNCFAD